VAKAHGRDADGAPIYFCIWCGSRRNLTREHVLAKKWRKHLGDAASPRVVSGWQLDLASLQPIAIDETTPRQGSFTWTVSHLVCGPCNNGWMSRLEDAVEPLLFQAAMGHEVTLDAEQQAILLNWLAKTAIVMEFMDDQPKTFEPWLLDWMRPQFENTVPLPGFVSTVTPLSVSRESIMRSTPFARMRLAPLKGLEVVSTVRVATVQLGAFGLTTLYASDSDTWSAMTSTQVMSLLEDSLLAAGQPLLTVRREDPMPAHDHLDRHTRIAFEARRSLERASWPRT